LFYSIDPVTLNLLKDFSMYDLWYEAHYKFGTGKDENVTSIISLRLFMCTVEFMFP